MPRYKVTWVLRAVPRREPLSGCSQHGPLAGARPVQRPGRRTPWSEVTGQASAPFMAPPGGRRWQPPRAIAYTRMRSPRCLSGKTPPNKSPVQPTPLANATLCDNATGAPIRTPLCAGTLHPQGQALIAKRKPRVGPSPLDGPTPLLQLHVIRKLRLFAATAGQANVAGTDCSEQ